MEAQQIAQVVGAEIARTYPRLRLEQLALDQAGDILRLVISGPPDALVRARIISRRALDCLSASDSDVGGTVRALLHSKHAATWLAPFTWRTIQRHSSGSAPADIKDRGKR